MRVILISAEPQIKSPFFSVTFDPGAGTYSVETQSGQKLFTEARVELVHAQGIISSKGSNFDFTSKKSKFSDALGQGDALQISMIPKKSGPAKISLTLKAYAKDKLVTVGVQVENVSEAELPLQEICPIVVDGNKRSAFRFGADIDGLRLLTHGYSFLDCGDLYALKDERFEAISNWNLALFDPATSGGLTIGGLKHDETETQIILGRQPESSARDDRTAMALRVTCSSNRKHKAMFRYFKTEKETKIPSGWTQDYSKNGWVDEPTEVHHQYLLPPRGKLSAGPIAIIPDDDPFTTLESWADCYRDLNQIRLPRPLPSGWCSWPDLYHNINEINILRIADFAKEKHLDDFGFDVIQVDDGFQRKWGDWDGNLYFPRGMKWLSNEIRKRGFTPGIWLAPYAISINHDLVSQKPAMLYQTIGDQIRTLTYYIGIPIYGLDISHPESGPWVQTLFRSVSEDWGYRFFKLDYIYDTVLNAERYHNPYLTKSQVYHAGLKRIREAVGDSAYVLECGSVSAAGLCDSWRCNADIGASWDELIGVRRTGRAVPKRYYLHGKLFHNDPDHLVVRDPLTPDQARVLATNVAMSGGQVLTGDVLYNLPDDRLQIIKQVLPPYGKAAKPLDLFETNLPGVNLLRIEREFETWWVLSVTNWEKRPVYKTIDLKKAGLDPKKKFLAFEFWGQEFYGVIDGQLAMELDATSVKVFALRELSAGPQIIGTDRHITQGGVELSEMSFEKNGKAIEGVFHGARDHVFNLFVYSPEGYRLSAFSTGGSKAIVTRPFPNVIQMGVHFQEQKQRKFNICFEKIKQNQ